jgi:acyl-CoA synthetase (AMP-forming)/AMP-acid ligase II
MKSTMQDAPLSISRLLEHAAARAPRHRGRDRDALRHPPPCTKFAKWQLPDAWAFIESVPRTSVGKFDKKVIRQDFADGALDVKRL